MVDPLALRLRRYIDGIRSLYVYDALPLAIKDLVQSEAANDIAKAVTAIRALLRGLEGDPSHASCIVSVDEEDSS